MQTSANVSRPPLVTYKDQPGENSQSASTASQRFTDSFGSLDRDCGYHRLNSIVTFAYLAGELETHRVRPGHGPFAYTDIIASSANKNIGLCPVTSAGADRCAATSLPTAK